MLTQLAKQDVVVEYMYAFVEKEHHQAQVVLRVQDKVIMEKAMKAMGLAVN